MLKLFLTVLLCLVPIVRSQLWRADYFKDEIMKFSTQECWLNKTADPKKPGTIRLAFVGDSTTLGIGSKRDMMNFGYDYHQTTDGSKGGF